MIRAALPLALALPAFPAHAQTAPAAQDRLVFPAEFFAESQPATAYDMVLRLPGFSFDEGDADVRGLAGSGGNVLIDGRRPAAKGDTLDVILKRIPASAVLRIELIRGGGNGIDMQGASVIANVVRKDGAAIRGQAEASFARYGDGRTAPAVRVNISRTQGDAQSEAALSLYQTVDDEKGKGPRVRTNANGSVRERAVYDERDRLRGGEAALSHEQAAFGGRIQITGSLKRERERADTALTFLLPAPELEQVHELQTDDNGEIGLGWSGPVAPTLTLELTGLQRFTRENDSEHSDDGGSTRDVAETGIGGESVARGLLRWQPGKALTVEAGGEAAYNHLDSHSTLANDNVAVALPAANVRVAERRAEGFGTATWHPSPRLSIETGIRVEVSRLVQTGDSSLTKSFVFAKPRVALTWSSGPQTQWRAGLDRDVSQLDFGDFVSSTSLTANTITAGNIDLEPQRVWTASLVWERRFGGSGAVVITARHEWISHTLDRVGIIGPGFAFDAQGNIGNGSKTKVEASLTVPLDRLGIAGGLLKVDTAYRWTRVIDPTTGLPRPISGEEPWEGEAHFTQDRPAIGFRWGIDYKFAKDEVEYRFDEIRRDLRNGRLSAFAEYRLAPHWTLRAFAENITGRPVERDRTIYAGSRASQPLRYTEVRRLESSPLIGLLLRRNFGEK